MIGCGWWRRRSTLGFQPSVRRCARIWRRAIEQQRSRRQVEQALEQGWARGCPRWYHRVREAGEGLSAKREHGRRREVRAWEGGSARGAVVLRVRARQSLRTGPRSPSVANRVESRGQSVAGRERSVSRDAPSRYSPGEGSGRMARKRDGQRRKTGTCAGMPVESRIGGGDGAESGTRRGR